MTKIGLYLAKRSVNRSEIARRTGISKARLNQLSNNLSTKLTAEELYKIALAMEINPCEVLKAIFNDLRLNGK